MNRERWTLLLMRGKDCKVKQFSVSARTAYVAIASACLMSTTAAGMSLSVGLGAAARAEAKELQEQNVVLSSTLEVLQERIRGLEGTLGELASADEQIRVMAGLDAIEDDVLQAGVGGPGMSVPESHPLYAVNEDLGKTAFAVTYDLNALERRAQLLDESFAEAKESMTLHKDLLESTPSILPLGVARLSSKYSASRFHPIRNRAMPHEGIDFAAPRGSPIMAAARGRVIRAGNFSGYGLMVEIDHGFGFVTRYGHASKILVRVGQTVQRGDVIANVGSTGIATGPHVHYEVRLNGQPQNPLSYVLPNVP
jgi:murein DD-endopeptidase MepM/ murein hydrolase activator NlpD